MVVSDDDYVEASDEDIDIRVRGNEAPSGNRSRSTRANKESSGFEVTRTWENLTEGADGTITGAVEGLLQAGKRQRLLKDTTPLQRGIIRHVVLILDLAVAMLEKDLRPTRYLLTIRCATEFVTEFFEQNPISQLAIIGMRDGLAVRISNMSGNPNDHISSLHELRKQEPRGQPSLENALEMARANLFHAPTHGTREVLLVFGALHTADPGDIHLTIANLVKDKIRARVIGLAAQVAICAELVSKTNNGDQSNYTIVLNEQHFRETMMELTIPPVISVQTRSASSLLMMGFPSRTVEKQPSLCACHARPSREGYLCSRCGSKVCGLPSECPTCGLTLILSTHLARSYHHLFPLVGWEEVPWHNASRSTHCFACGKVFPEFSSKDRWEDEARHLSGRYECTVCRRHFCIDCDLFAHEVVHNCPGCQSGRGLGAGGADSVDRTDDVAVEGLEQRDAGADVNGKRKRNTDDQVVDKG